jgi:hypothetical protein
MPVPLPVECGGGAIWVIKFLFATRDKQNARDLVYWKRSKPGLVG